MSSVLGKLSLRVAIILIEYFFTKNTFEVFTTNNCCEASCEIKIGSKEPSLRAAVYEKVYVPRDVHGLV